MKIIVDSREQDPYKFTGPKYEGVTIEVGTLATGDYSVAGLTSRISIERKTLDDCAGTITVGRERFERELDRSRGYDFFAVVIEADMSHVAQHNYRSRMNPVAFIQSLFAFQVRYGVHMIWCGDRSRAEYATYGLLSKFVIEKQREMEAIMDAAS